VHFAVVARDDTRIGTLGRGLPSLLESSGQDWSKLAAAFQTQHSTVQGDELAVFAPLAGPMPPTATVVAATLQSVPAAATVIAPASQPAGAAEPAPELKAPITAVGAETSPRPAVVLAEGANAATIKAPQFGLPRSSETKAADLGGPATSGSTEPARLASLVAPPRVSADRKPIVPTPQSTPRAMDPRTGRIQVALARRGLYGGQVNGVADAGTTEAVRAFQRALGDPPNGVLTQIQIVKLLNVE